jgi:hypothetical protein
MFDFKIPVGVIPDNITSDMENMMSLQGAVDDIFDLGNNDGGWNISGWTKRGTSADAGAEQSAVSYKPAVKQMAMARKCHNMVLGGMVRAAVRMVTNRDGGGAYRPFDLDSKSGCPVIDVLREKHPTSRVPSEEDFNEHPRDSDCLESMPVYCYEECVAKAAARLSGGAEPCGVESNMLKNWLLRHGVQLERLRDVMATWVDWLSNGSPPHTAYRAVNTVRTVALDKTPGVRPLGVGESWMRLWLDCSHTKVKV